MSVLLLVHSFAITVCRWCSPIAPVTNTPIYKLAKQCFLALSYVKTLASMPGDTDQFLANDVTLVTSYGYCQSLKINDIRVVSVLRFVRLGGCSVRRCVGVCTRTLKLLTLSAAQTHTAYTIGVRPPGFEVFCISESQSTGTIYKCN